MSNSYTYRVFAYQLLADRGVKPTLALTNRKRLWKVEGKLTYFCIPHVRGEESLFTYSVYDEKAWWTNPYIRF